MEPRGTSSDITSSVARLCLRQSSPANGDLQKETPFLSKGVVSYPICRTAFDGVE